MSNNTFKTLVPIKFANTVAAHSEIPKIPWFRDRGVSTTYPSYFTTNHGAVQGFPSNVDGRDYITGQSNPFWPQEGSDSGYGFSVTKNPGTPGIEFNYQISGGDGFWLPCPMWRSLSFVWENTTASPANYSPRRFALICKNWKTDAEKLWSPGWNTTVNTAAFKTTYIFNGWDKSKQVRNLGTDWYVYGVIFNFLSNSLSSSDTAPLCKLSDFRLGYSYNLYSNINTDNNSRWILTKKQSWSNLKSMLSSGVYKFESYT